MNLCEVQIFFRLKKPQLLRAELKALTQMMSAFVANKFSDR